MGGLHSLALKANGSILGWGLDNFGQATPPAGNDYVAIAAGWEYSLALKADGSIVGWGHNYQGRATPPEGNDFITIAAGLSYGLALKADGSIIGWGLNDDGEATPPQGNGFTAIAAGLSHSLALRFVCDFDLIGDLNNDCEVNFADFVVFAEQWRLEKLDWDINVDRGDGIVNFKDWTVFANTWEGMDLAELADFAEQWLMAGAYSADIEPWPDGNGVVDGYDFAGFIENWLVNCTTDPAHPSCVPK